MWELYRHPKNNFASQSLSLLIYIFNSEWQDMFSSISFLGDKLSIFSVGKAFFSFKNKIKQRTLICPLNLGYNVFGPTVFFYLLSFKLLNVVVL